MFSKNSNQSRQCPKEVNIADNKGIPIICIAIDDIDEMNSSLQYYLTCSHIMVINAKKIKHNIDNILVTVKDTLNNKRDYDNRINLDTQIQLRFDELSEDRKRPQQNAESYFVDILDKKIAQNYVRYLSQNNSKSDDNKTGLSEGDFNKFGGCKTLCGLDFSIIDSKERNTVIYRTIKNYDITNFTYYFTAERLDFINDELDNEKSKRTFL